MGDPVNYFHTFDSDDERCRTWALNAADIMLYDPTDREGTVWLSCKDAPYLSDWR